MLIAFCGAMAKYLAEVTNGGKIVFGSHGLAMVCLHVLLTGTWAAPMF